MRNFSAETDFIFSVYTTEVRELPTKLILYYSRSISATATARYPQTVHRRIRTSQ